MTRIVCQQDIIQIIQKFPDITSDELASWLAIGLRIQDVLLETVKLLVTKSISLPDISHHNRKNAIKELVAFKKKSPEVFKAIIEAYNPPEVYLMIVGVLPLAGLTMAEFQIMLNEADIKT
jgi:hypothetical protein